MFSVVGSYCGWEYHASIIAAIIMSGNTPIGHLDILPTV